MGRQVQAMLVVEFAGSVITARLELRRLSHIVLEQCRDSVLPPIMGYKRCIEGDCVYVGGGAIATVFGG